MSRPRVVDGEREAAEQPFRKAATLAPDTVRYRLSLPDLLRTKDGVFARVCAFRRGVPAACRGPAAGGRAGGPGGRRGAGRDGFTARGDDQVVLEYDRDVAVTPGGTVVEHLVINLESDRAATYEVTLTVRGRIAGRETTVQCTFVATDRELTR